MSYPNFARSFLVLSALGALGCAGETATSVPSSGAEVRPLARAAETPPAFFESLVAAARARAASPYVQVATMDERSRLAAMRYDEHRRIRFRPEASLFRGGEGRFEAQFFHLGGTSRTPVSIFLLGDAGASPYSYDRRSFVFDASPLPDELVAPSYSGFRLHAPINTDAYKDEVIVFQGASYFRAVGRGEAYGLSARGLALDTGTARPEEFPVFDAFYLAEPRAGDAHAWVLASLTSPRAEGAYAFRIVPGDATEVEVTARVFVRGEVEVLGAAPLTSMFLFGEEGPARFGDFRPEVHDSDTLVIVSGHGERTARPLRNPPRTTVTSHRLDHPRAFGLVQRDRTFDHYQDLEARYHERPTAWVTPMGDWGTGTLRLLEIATELETDDNIGAMWVPDAVPADGLALRYVVAFGPSEGEDTGARALATRIARTAPSRARFLVDFAGRTLEDARDVLAHVTVTNGRLVESHVEPNAHVGGVRLSFEVEATGADVELRAFLGRGADALSETWSYLWQPTH